MTRVDEIFNDSYERCLAKEEFLDTFYAKYIASNKIVAQKFANTDMEKQKDMLKGSLHMIMALRLSRPEDAEAYFRRIGVVHGRKKHDIAPELYDLWLTCLLEAVQECDEQYDIEIDTAWREVLSGGIKIMKSMY